MLNALEQNRSAWESQGGVEADPPRLPPVGRLSLSSGGVKPPPQSPDKSNTVQHETSFVHNSYGNMDSIVWQVNLCIVKNQRGGILFGIRQTARPWDPNPICMWLCGIYVTDCNAFTALQYSQITITCDEAAELHHVDQNVINTTTIWQPPSERFRAQVRSNAGHFERKLCEIIVTEICSFS